MNLTCLTLEMSVDAGTLSTFSASTVWLDFCPSLVLLDPNLNTIAIWGCFKIRRSPRNLVDFK